ncbi:7650_t:CDS:2 [Paraglomus brasilianum]|uniref:7650_t:CDS:1 n=1 Tax=Paraglomus brasilianum TaxID=144538 RepID=A0A9N9E3M8_9GLOM|nr:7650_t:CDS:2 [Paraglomus brasilianum]
MVLAVAIVIPALEGTGPQDCTSDVQILWQEIKELGQRLGDVVERELDAEVENEDKHSDNASRSTIRPQRIGTFLLGFGSWAISPMQGLMLYLRNMLAFS